jgi:hypothetical protein
VAGRLALPSRAAVAVAALRLSAADCCLFHNVSWIQGYPDFTYALSDVSSRPNSPIGVQWGIQSTQTGLLPAAKIGCTGT